MKLFLLTFVLVLTSKNIYGQETSLLSQIKSHQSGIGLWWAGHNSWIIKSGDLVISTDLVLEYDLRIHPPKITGEELAEILDISFVTHGHGDHFNRAITKTLIEKSNCHFVVPESCRAIAENLKIPHDRLSVVSPRDSFNIMGIQVRTLRAIHGNADFAIYYDANLQDCGYVLDIDGTTFLQPGDSYLLEDHLFLNHVDVLFFSPTEHNMYIDRSVILINRLQPEYILPQHHSTMKVTDETRFWAKGYPDEVKIRLSQPLKDRYYILKEGDKLEIR
ncbi:MAG: MBL fold metallo-hydrolase [Saprospiraceae bacterium]|nr:MBL fold metallo-hydrolase [Saprospiraceae bacterium]